MCDILIESFHFLSLFVYVIFIPAILYFSPQIFWGALYFTLAAGDLQPYKNGLWKNTWLFFLSANRVNTSAGQSHSSSFQHLGCGENSMRWSMRKHLTCMFEGGSLYLNLIPVANIPWKPATSRVVWLSCRTIFANTGQIYYLFHTWGNCVNLHSPTTIRKHVYNMCVLQHNTHTKKRKQNLAIPTWNLLLKKKHCFCMVLVLSLHGWCNLSVL